MMYIDVLDLACQTNHPVVKTSAAQGSKQCFKDGDALPNLPMSMSSIWCELGTPMDQWTNGPMDRDSLQPSQPLLRWLETAAAHGLARDTGILSDDY